jgi:hypothetical protein
MRLCCILTFSIVLFCGFNAISQVTNSGITGFVSGEDGERLPGASVIAIHQPSGTQYGTITNSEGQYNLQGMRPGGPYTVDISFIGYATRSFSNITLVLGESLILNTRMIESIIDIGEVMVVGSVMSAFQTNKTGAATNIGSEQINVLPTINRSITDYTRLTPQAFGNSYAGRDGRYNNLQIDGASFNNAFGLNANLLPGGNSQAFSLDAIEEIQINIAPYDVKQSNFTGAGINAITRSGTNTFIGSLYGFYNNQNFQGRRIGDAELPEGQVALTQNYGFRLGGPIIRNRLFFFVNAERQDDTGANASGANIWRASQDGIANPENNIARTSAADLEAVRNHLISRWNYDPGRYEGYAGEASQYSVKYLARIDWNFNDSHKFAFRYNQVEGVANSLANSNSGPRPRSVTNRVSSNSITFEKGNYSTHNIVKSLTAELNSTLSRSFSNQFLATYSRIQDTRKSPGEIFPFVDIWDGARSGSGDPETNYMSFGYELFTYKNDIINDNYSFVNNVTYLIGRHTISGGISFDVQKFGNSYVRLGTSYYRYASVEDFLTTGTAGEVPPIMFGVTYPYEGQDPYARINFAQAALYLQDRFVLNEQLTFTYGMRIEFPFYLNELTVNESINSLELLDIDGTVRNYDSGSWPRSRIILSPRLGFKYDVTGDRSFTVRGGTGIFSGRIPFVWLTNMPANSGVIQNNVEPGSYGQISGWINNVRFNPEPHYWVNNPPAGAENVFIRTPEAGYPGSFALVDRHFKMPKVWRSSIGADYNIPGTPIIATTDILYTHDVHAVFQFGANRTNPATRMNYGSSGPFDPGDTRFYYSTPSAAQYNPALGANNAVVLTNTTVKGHAFSATLGLFVPSYNGISASLYYTFSESKSISDNPGSNASSAWGGSPSVNSPNEQILYHSQYSIPHSVKGTFSYRFEYLGHLTTTVSLFYNGAHTGRFSYIYSNDFNNDGINADLIYLPRNTSSLNFVEFTSGGVTFTPEQQRAAFDQFVKENGLEKYRGQYLGRNAFLMPWLNRFDFRLLQDLFTNIGNQRHSLQFSLDMFNIGNFLNRNWGIEKTFNNAESLLNVANITTDGVPSFRMNTVTEDGNTILPVTPFRNVGGISTTWSMQIGLRYNF